MPPTAGQLPTSEPRQAWPQSAEPRVARLDDIFAVVPADWAAGEFDALIPDAVMRRPFQVVAAQGARILLTAELSFHAAASGEHWQARRDQSGVPGRVTPARGDDNVVRPGETTDRSGESIF